MDILLAALLTVEGDHFKTRSDIFLYAAGDNAFADDMLSLTNRHAMLQHKADIVSAIVSALDKLRAFHFNFSQEEDNRVDPPNLIIHLYGWIPTHDGPNCL